VIGVIIAPDVNKLGSHRWNNNSGSILGYGNGSKAIFLPVTEERMRDEVSSCLHDGGFLSFSATCGATPIKPLAYTGYSPGSLTLGAFTVETNNLIPVIGNPPAHLPALHYLSNFDAEIVYVRARPGSGSPKRRRPVADGPRRGSGPRRPGPRRNLTKGDGAGAIRSGVGGLHASASARRAEPVERGLHDRLKVFGIAANRGDGDDHVEDLLKHEGVADLMGALCGEQERSAGRHDAGAASAHYRDVAI
jgi:hypothetical protein